MKNFRIYNLIVYNIIKNLSYYSFREKISSKKIDEINWLKEKIPLIFELIEKNKNDENIMEIKNSTIEDLNGIIKSHYEKFNDCQNKNLLMSIRYDYCFKRTFRKMNIQESFNNEHINFNLASFSNHTFYHSIYSPFISRNSFDKNKKVNYFEYQIFDIDIKNLEKELFSILFYRKNIFNKKINLITFRYDGLNKNENENNNYVIKNFLKKYSKKKMNKDLIQKFNNLIGRYGQDIYKNIYEKQKGELEIKKNNDNKLIQEKKKN